MNTTHHTTGTAVRAGALTVALAGLLFGAPAIASAGPGSTPTPHRPTTHCVGLPDTPKADPASPPVLTWSNSACTDASGNHPIKLAVSGTNFTSGGMVHLEAFVDGIGAPSWTNDYPAPGGVIFDDVFQNAYTDSSDYAVNGYVVAVDVATGRQTNRLPVLVKTF